MPNEPIRLIVEINKRDKLLKNIRTIMSGEQLKVSKKAR
jgi:hypothetical protein